MTRASAEPSIRKGPAGGGAPPALEALVFVLPFMVFYEVAGWWLAHGAPSAEGDRVVSFHLLELLFQLFGASGMLLPSLAIVLILLGMHVASRRAWSVRWGAVGLMYAEALLWAVPLLLFNHWFKLGPGGPMGNVLREASLCVGAGLYEELVFRLVLITVLVIVGVDLLGRPSAVVLPVATVVAALLFAAHHHPPIGGEPYEPRLFLFRTLAGVYLGWLFLRRGYGVAAGTHIAYNLLVLAQ